MGTVKRVVKGGTEDIRGGTRVNLWKFGGPVRRVSQPIGTDSFSTFLSSSVRSLPLGKKHLDGTRADASAIFDLALNRGGSQHHHRARTDRNHCSSPSTYTGSTPD